MLFTAFACAGVPWGVPGRDLQFYGPFVEMFFDRSAAEWKDLRSSYCLSKI
jgi:hypothetical protein